MAAGAGLYLIEGDRAVPLRAPNDSSFRTSLLVQSSRHRNRVWVGLFDGLASFRWSGGQWVDEGRVENVRDQVRTLVENPDGSLWAGTQATGLLRITFTGLGDTRPATATVERFGTAQGLQPGGVTVQALGREMYYS
jgi:hypothetical protein